ncbi:exopolysaccharide biosynthesis protein [Pontibacter diazotrophicus]|uniref:Exopolysaccharide biosynthesis protein n=1 Tax=Pontibacter diazotrophicus TaxID=1400979 RepID=A0A3D8LHN3_9BACT|nr:glycosyltransferase [Pontibacter diazotrophicus]RDV16846.1 exopolysaccharide biosynthesis protein [Pontibacter diazotrophicus]
MILVLLGTFPTDFKRPLLEIEKLCSEGEINEEVIVQCGHTQIESSFMQMQPFISPDVLTSLYINARVVISQAGTGSLMKGIKLNKKIIAIPRLAKYGEVVDNHQVEILNEFSKLNYIIPWTEDVALKSLLQEINDFEPATYISKKQVIIEYLTDYIESV